MKKSTFKAFTLVEMLIVIVIIGILIASLMPRMQTAQGRARDVARKNDLSQIQTAIITSQSDRKSWPGMWTNKKWEEDATAGITIASIDTLLMQAWMSAVPTDPNGSNVVYWLGSTANTTAWQYIYLVAKRNWVANAWFALMAKTEVEWSSNWVTCANNGAAYAGADATKARWYITNGEDLAGVTLCEKVEKADACDASACKYKDTWELRYLLVY